MKIVLPNTLIGYVLARNEESQISSAVKSLNEISDVVVVVDSFSTDHTEQEAATAGATVWRHQFESFSAQRNYAIDRITEEFNPAWILTIDADERLSHDLVSELRARILSGDASQWDAFAIPRVIRFSGRLLRFGGVSRTRLVRLYRPDAGAYEDRSVNEHYEISHGARLGRLTAPIIHEDVECWNRYIAKHNQYSTLEARERLLSSARRDAPLTAVLKNPQLRRRFIRERIWNGIPAKPFVRFAQMYIFAGGILDGSAGFRIAVFQAWHEMCIEEKYKELLRKGSDLPPRARADSDR